MENSDGSGSFGISSWDDPFRTQAAIQAHTGMDLLHVLTNGGGAAVSDQQSLALQALQAMMQCQQLTPASVRIDGRCPAPPVDYRAG